MGYTVWPIANGNWSNAANWSSGAVPTLDDNVYLNGKTVTADQNMSCYTVRNDTVRAIFPNMEIPNMVNNTSGATYSTTLAVGIANASGNTTTAWQAFAFPSSATFWTSATNNTGWVSYQFTTGKVIKRYYIGDAGTAGARPKDWTFEGSNDGSSWTTLDTVTGAASAAYTSGALANTTSYTYYRINITAVQTLGNPPRVTRFEMTESTSTNYSTTTGGTLTISTAYNLTIAESFRTVGAGSFITISASSGTVNITSNSGFLTRNGYIIANGLYGISITGGGVVINTTGDISNSSTTGADYTGLFAVTSACIINHFGNVNSTITTFLGPPSSSININNANCQLNIVGDIIGGISGSLTSTTNANCIRSNGNVTVTGNVLGGINEPIVITASTAQLIINGNCTAYNATKGNAISSAGTVLLNGNATNVNGFMAIYARTLKLKSTTQIVWTFQDELGNNKVLYSAGAGAGVGMPNQADVREGTVYGAASELEGTLIVPSAVNVRIGVPFDNTVGTGEVTAEDILDAIETSPDDLAVRLRNVATIQSTAATVAAYNG